MKLVPIESADGARAQGRLFEAAPGSPRLLVLPAMGVNARAYDRTGELFAEAGVTALVAEHRGGESSSVRVGWGVDYGYPELLGDLDAQLAAAGSGDGGPVHLLGHSLGAHLATLGVGKWARSGARLAVVAAGTIHYRSWRGLSGLGIFAATQLAGALARRLPYFPGHRLGFGGRQSSGLISEWARTALTGEFRGRRGERLEQDLSLHAPDVLAVSVRGDTWAPRSATEGLVRKLPRARVEWAQVAPPPEPRRLQPHFRWLKEPRPVVEAVTRFLGAR